MKKTFFIILFLLLMGGVLGAESEINEEIPDTFEYLTTVDVLCSEYKGYVRFELPETMSAEQYYQTNIPVSLTIDRSFDSVSRSSNWFVTSIDGYNIRQVEALYDGSVYTDLIVENNQIQLPFKNPNTQSVSHITIQTADSVLTDISLLVNGESISFTQSQSGFYYQLELDQVVESNSITVELSYEDVAKIAEVSFSHQMNVQSDYGYFYVDNNCNETLVIYHGTYQSENRFQSGSQTLPVIFLTDVKTAQNPLYDYDFDDDGIENSVDNCLNTPNADQKDIDYNNRGDACQDEDRDGVFDSIDNCPERFNSNQEDSDGDSVGDVCEEEDNRFFEENAPFVYLLGFLIAVVFVLLAVKIVKQH